MENSGMPINSQQLTYEQFQEQVQMRREQERQQAQQALKKAGLDKDSQQLNQIIVEFHHINEELQLAENQLQSQMDAQRRQIQSIKQRMQQAEQQVKNVIAYMSSANAQQPPNQAYTAPYMQ
ncbi:hypothetical protein [Paenibacillus sp. GCM10027626]|uniref:hypothetical protein n=1 Tax=Paenibacillus sp. GCM10027626 TaxID=3273411 RepID=UPI0036346F80